MPEDQLYYYACGESAEKIAKLPQVERILDKGYEILYCTETWMTLSCAAWERSTGRRSSR